MHPTFLAAEPIPILKINALIAFIYRNELTLKVVSQHGAMSASTLLVVTIRLTAKFLRTLLT